MKPIVWMRAIRDLGELPAARLAVLWALALRMDVKGSGFAATRTLEDDAKVSRATVKRATKWARDGDWLVQVERGHRLGNGRTVASRWQLTTPSQGLTGEPLTQSQGLTTPSQGLTREPQEVLTQEIPSPPFLVPQGQTPAAAQNGGRDPHKNEPNARRAIAALVTERALPFTADRLLDLAYTINTDPWKGYLAINHHTQDPFDRARDPMRVLRHRMGLKAMTNEHNERNT